MKYRKKPIVVEAIRWTGKNQTEIDKLCGLNVVWSENKKMFLVLTLEGTMLASAGDYIIKGVNGEFYPCKPDVFAKTYEAVEE
jgi:hypothetical protein